MERLDFSPAELSDQLEADQRGLPYLAYRAPGSSQQLMKLGRRRRITIGRGTDNALRLDWDPEVSRSHAILESVGGRWTLLDQGLSRNGTFVNEQRIAGRRVLSDRDVMRFGHTEVLYRNPFEGGDETPLAGSAAQLVRLTDAQRRVLIALCRPSSAGEILVTASNSDIAAELSVSTEAVRSQLKTLFTRFEVPDLPQNRKRSELARRALASGIVTQRDLHTL